MTHTGSQEQAFMSNPQTFAHTIFERRVIQYYNINEFTKERPV